MFDLVQHLKDESRNKATSKVLADFISKCAVNGDESLLEFALCDLELKLKAFAKKKWIQNTQDFLSNLKRQVVTELVSKDAVIKYAFNDKHYEIMMKHYEPLADLNFCYHLIQRQVFFNSDYKSVHPYFFHSNFATAEKITAGLFNGMQIKDGGDTMFSKAIIQRFINPSDLLCLFQAARSKAIGINEQLIPDNIDTDEFEALCTLASKKAFFIKPIVTDGDNYKACFDLVLSGKTIADLKNSSFSHAKETLTTFRKAVDNFIPELGSAATHTTVLNDEINKWSRIGMTEKTLFSHDHLLNPVFQANETGYEFKAYHSLSCDEEYLAKLIDIVTVMRGVAGIVNDICKAQIDIERPDYVVNDSIHILQKIRRMADKDSFNSCIGNMPLPDITELFVKWLTLDKRLIDHTYQSSHQSSFIHFCLSNLPTACVIEAIEKHRFSDDDLSNGLLNSNCDVFDSPLKERSSNRFNQLMLLVKEQMTDNDEFNALYKSMIFERFSDREANVVENDFFRLMSKKNTEQLEQVFDQAVKNAIGADHADTAFMQPNAL